MRRGILCGAWVVFSLGSAALSGCATTPQPIEVSEPGGVSYTASITGEPQSDFPVITVAVLRHETLQHSLLSHTGQRTFLRSTEEESQAPACPVILSLTYSGSVHTETGLTDSGGLASFNISPHIKAAFEDVRNADMTVDVMLTPGVPQSRYVITLDKLSSMYRTLQQRTEVPAR